MASRSRRLVSDRRQLKLTEEQERFARARFGDLSREELLNVLTRVTAEGGVGLGDLHEAGGLPLRRDEAVLRDMAFSHLTRQEILNLLTRRFWHALRARKLADWRWRRRHGQGMAARPPEPEAARGPVAS